MLRWLLLVVGPLTPPSPRSYQPVAPTFDTSLDGARRALEDLAGWSRLVSDLSDFDLLDIQRDLSDLDRGLGASAAVVAGQIGHRSRRELGYAGLAPREGFQTPEALIRHETGSTARLASALVQVGTMARDFGMSRLCQCRAIVSGGRCGCRGGKPFDGCRSDDPQWARRTIRTCRCGDP